MLRHRSAPWSTGLALVACLLAGSARAYTIESQTLQVATQNSIEAPYCTPDLEDCWTIVDFGSGSDEASGPGNLTATAVAVAEVPNAYPVPASITTTLAASTILTPDQIRFASELTSTGDLQYLFDLATASLVYDVVFSVDAPTQYAINDGAFSELYDVDNGVWFTELEGTLAPGRYRWVVSALFDASSPTFGDRLSLVTIPEPGVAWMLGAGLLLLARRRRRTA